MSACRQTNWISVPLNQWMGLRCHLRHFPLPSCDWQITHRTWKRPTSFSDQHLNISQEYPRGSWKALNTCELVIECRELFSCMRYTHFIICKLCRLHWLGWVETQYSCPYTVYWQGLGRDGFRDGLYKPRGCLNPVNCSLLQQSNTPEPISQADVALRKIYHRKRQNTVGHWGMKFGKK